MTLNNDASILARMQSFECIFCDPRHYSKDFPRSESFVACSNCLEECGASFMSTGSSNSSLCMRCFKALNALRRGHPNQVGMPFNVQHVMSMSPTASVTTTSNKQLTLEKHGFSFGGPATVDKVEDSSVPKPKRPLEYDPNLPPEVNEAKHKGMR